MSRFFMLNDQCFRLRHVTAVATVKCGQTFNYVTKESSDCFQFFVQMNNPDCGFLASYPTEPEAIAVRQALLDALETDAEHGSC